jgi:hypothetical protein
MIRRLAVLLFVAACGAGPLEPAERREFENAQRKWTGHALEAYSYEVRVGCFCPPELNAWTRVTVVRDSIVRTEALEPLPYTGGQPLPLSWWPTVQELFIAITNARRSDYTKDIVAQYDTDYGYPRRIEIECKSNIADCGTHYEARNLTPQPGLR